MRSLARLSRILLVVGIITALAVGALTLLSPPASAKKKGPCICALIFDPVVCKGGRMFSNQCLADCKRAKDCEPL